MFSCYTNNKSITSRDKAHNNIVNNRKQQQNNTELFHIGIRGRLVEIKAKTLKVIKIGRKYGNRYQIIGAHIESQTEQGSSRNQISPYAQKYTYHCVGHNTIENSRAPPIHI